MKELNLRENGFWLRQIESAYTNNLDLDSILDTPEMVKSLSLKDIKDAAKKYFKNDYVEAVLYPESRKMK